MGVGIRTSQDEVAERASQRAAQRTSTEWSTVTECWTTASPIARVGCALAAALAITAAVVDSIPITSAFVVLLVTPAVLVDTQQRRLPDMWIGAAAIVLLIGVGITWSTGSTSPSVLNMAVATTLMAGPLLVLHLVSPASMGFGDVKLAIVLGAAIGMLDWNLAVPALALAAGSTATVGLCTRARHIAFGPGLLGGALVAMLAHDLLVGG